MLRTATPEDEAQTLTESLRRSIEEAVAHVATAQALLHDVATLAKGAFESEAWKTLGYELGGILSGRVVPNGLHQMDA
jgi:hypothetical protein